MTAIAGRHNSLVRLWIQGFARVGRSVPYHTAEDVEAGLYRLGQPVEREAVTYLLRFADTEENRMKILLDNEPLVAADLHGSALVVHYLEAAKKSLRGTERMILGLRLDGADVPAAHLEAALTRPVAQLTTLEFITASAPQVVADALQETLKALTDSFVTVREASEALSKGRLAEAMERLTDCIGVWSRTHEALIHGGALLRLDFERMAIAGRPMLDWLADLAHRLREIRDAIEAATASCLATSCTTNSTKALRAQEQMLKASFNISLQIMKTPRDGSCRWMMRSLLADCDNVLSRERPRRSETQQDEFGGPLAPSAQRAHGDRGREPFAA
jgi:hypothetical protein